jgi:hypothetical protein
MIDYIFPALWALGWFVTLALTAAVSFTKLGPIDVLGAVDDDPGAPPWLVAAFFAAIILGLFWPVVLALQCGWFLWPFMAKLVAARGALRQP